MTAKRRDILDRIVRLQDQASDLACEMSLLREVCRQLKQERDAAIQRAERAEIERDANYDAFVIAFNLLRVRAQQSTEERMTSHV